MAVGARSQEGRGVLWGKNTQQIFIEGKIIRMDIKPTEGVNKT